MSLPEKIFSSPISHFLDSNNNFPVVSPSPVHEYDARKGIVGVLAIFIFDAEWRELPPVHSNDRKERSPLSSFMVCQINVDRVTIGDQLHHSNYHKFFMPSSPSSEIYQDRQNLRTRAPALQSCHIPPSVRDERAIVSGWEASKPPSLTTSTTSHLVDREKPFSLFERRVQTYNHVRFSPSHGKKRSHNNKTSNQAEKDWRSDLLQNTQKISSTLSQRHCLCQKSLFFFNRNAEQNEREWPTLKWPLYYSKFHTSTSFEHEKLKLTHHQLAIKKCIYGHLSSCSPIERWWCTRYSRSDRPKIQNVLYFGIFSIENSHSYSSSLSLVGWDLIFFTRDGFLDEEIFQFFGIFFRIDAQHGSREDLNFFPKFWNHEREGSYEQDGQSGCWWSALLRMSSNEYWRSHVCHSTLCCCSGTISYVSLGYDTKTSKSNDLSIQSSIHTGHDDTLDNVRWTRIR